MLYLWAGLCLAALHCAFLCCPALSCAGLGWAGLRYDALRSGFQKMLNEKLCAVPVLIMIASGVLSTRHPVLCRGSRRC